MEYAQELHRLLERLSQEIFHEENYNAIPSMERIKAAMAALNEYAGKRHLTEAPPLDEEKCVYCDGTGEYCCPEFAGADGSDGWYKCEECDGTGSKLPSPNKQIND